MHAPMHQVQLMPLAEHSDAWGYNPRQLMALHGAYGSPDDMRRFVSVELGGGMCECCRLTT